MIEEEFNHHKKIQMRMKSKTEEEEVEVLDEDEEEHSSESGSPCGRKREEVDKASIAILWNITPD